MGTALITKFADEKQLGSVEVFRTLIAYVELAARPLKVVELCHVIPSLLYCSDVPKGVNIPIVPVGVAQVG